MEHREGGREGEGFSSGRLTSLQVLCHFSMGALRARDAGLNPIRMVVMLD